MSLLISQLLFIDEFSIGLSSSLIFMNDVDMEAQQTQVQTSNKFLI